MEGVSKRSNDSARHDPLVGQRLASYEILKRVARGGMGVVYRARHVYIDKIVALKVLDPALAGREDLIERFRIEAQSLAKVEHANVVKVIDILEDKGMHFIVMDFAEGKDLRRIVKKKGPLSADLVLSVAKQTAEALWAAHREGILHRDIKPENLIINARGRCKLADFGLAGDLRLIAEGHEGPLTFGTPAYSAPEVLRKKTPDRRSDVFGFGATIYFLATGEPPFGATGTQQIGMRQKQGAQLIEAYRSDLPPAMTSLVMDCMHVDPRDRPQDFREVLDRIPAPKRVPDAVPLTATNPTGPLDTRTDGSMTFSSVEATGGVNKLPLFVGGGALLLVLALGGLLWWKNAQTNPPINPDNATGNRSSISRGNTGNKGSGNESRTRPRDNTANDPTTNPDQVSFNDAELTCRDALLREDYPGAYQIWSDWIREHPESELRSQAESKRDGVVNTVNKKRKNAFDLVERAVSDYLNNDKTGEALAEVEAYPEVLLTPMFESEPVAVVEDLGELRDKILDAEQRDLDDVLEDAKELREDWKDSQNQSESRRRMNAANLLDERQLLGDFKAHRTSVATKKIDDRLKELDGLLTQLERDSEIPVALFERWRGVNERNAAKDALRVFEQARKLMRLRRVPAASKSVSKALKDETKRRENLRVDAEATQLAEILKNPGPVESALVSTSEIVAKVLSMHEALSDEFRAAQATGRWIDFAASSGRDDDDSPNGRINRFSARVTKVQDHQVFVRDKSGKDMTVEYGLLATSFVRDWFRESSDFRYRLTLVWWLAAVGKSSDANSEAKRLRREQFLTSKLKDELDAIDTQDVFGSLENRLRFLATMPTDPVELKPDSPEQQLRLAEKSAGSEYLAACVVLTDRALIRPVVFRKAILQATPTREYAQLWTEIEPFNPKAWLLLARAEADNDEHGLSRLAAQRALVLNPALKDAWRILHP